MSLDETHDAALASWVDSANDPNTDFPIQNLPFGVYRKRGTTEQWRGCVAIGDHVLDLAGVDAATGPTLNGLAASGPGTWRALRRQLSDGLSDGGRKGVLTKYLTPMVDIEMRLPVDCGDYTDFFSSYYHAYNAGRLFRPDAPLTPNFKWLPIAYHGRASSIVTSGTPIRRPNGQFSLPGQDRPRFGPTAWLDYELELGIVMGPGNAHGSEISMRDAENHIFGITLLNDWSARDIQAWEYQPLGPFLSKNFATTISPWIVTLDALAPFREPAFKRFDGDPLPLPHLMSDRNEETGHMGIAVEAWIRPADTQVEQRLSRSNYAHAYWTPAQLIAHHTSNGCPVNPGDILGTGTISGPGPEEAGSLLELSQAATKPIVLNDGETRTFLEDGDTVILRASCQRDGFRRIGFGKAAGRILPAKEAAT